MLHTRDVLCDCVILTIARSRREGGKRRRPHIVNAVLDPVAQRLDAQIDGSIDLGDSRAALAFAALLNDLQKSARGHWAVTLAGTTYGERLFV